MNKFKDFLYDKNDIIVTLIILIIAIIIISFRVNAIMEYPNTLLDKQSAQAQTQASSSAPAAAPAKTAESGSSQASAPAAAAAEPSSDPHVKTLTVSESDTSAATVSADLEELGLVGSAEKFRELIKSYDAEFAIKAGTYELPESLTDKQIIEIITKKTLQD